MASSQDPIEFQNFNSQINALISCLCKLHNFCIDNGNARLPERYSHDPLTLMDFMDSDESNASESPRPIGLLGGGEHFADVSGGHREQIRLSRCQRQHNNNAHWEFPRNSMLHHVTEMDIHRPRSFKNIYITLLSCIISHWFHFHYQLPCVQYPNVPCLQNVACYIFVELFCQ